MNSFIFERKKLLSALKAVQKFCNKDGIWARAFFRVDWDRVTVTSGLFSAQATIYVDIEPVEGDGYLFSIDANILTKWLSLSNNEKYNLVVNENGGIKIYWKSEKVEFAWHSDDENMVFWSSFSETYKNSLDIMKDDFVWAVQKASIATSKDVTRPALQGVCFSFEGETLSVAATDTYKLVWTDLKIPQATEAKDYIVHWDTCDAIIDAIWSEFSDEEVSVSFGVDKGIIVSGDVTVYFRMIEGKFPPYKQIIPPTTSDSIIISCDAQEIIWELKKIVLFVDDDKTSFVRLSYDDKMDLLRLQNTKTKAGTADSAVSCNANTNGHMVEDTSYNAKYMLSVMSLFDSVSLTKSSTKAMWPMKVEQKWCSTKALLMPVRIS